MVLTGRPLTAWVYLLPEDVQLAAPTADYVAAIRRGYEAHGFDTAALDAAAADAVRCDDLVFVYGSLLSGFGNHRLLCSYGAQRVAEAVTADAAYTMRSLGPFPAVARGGDQRIRGEIYRVDRPTLAALDRLEGHPRFYRRQQVCVVEASGRRLTAWAFLRPDAGNTGVVVPDGDWRTFTTQNARRE